MIEVFSALPQAWGYVEPLLYLAGALAGLLWWARRKWWARRLTSRFAREDGRFVLVVQVGRNVEEDVAARLGQVDAVVSWEGLLASPRDYRAVLVQVREALRKARGGQLDLVVAGPLALAFLLGQEVGRTRWRVRFWQFQRGDYLPLDTLEVGL